MHAFSYQNTTNILFGRGMVSKLSEAIAPFGPKILLVAGGGSIKKSGLYDLVREELDKAGKQVFELWGVQPNPRLTSVREGIAICKKEGIDFILAVGGGSVVDAAKGMAAGAVVDHDVWEFYLHERAVGDALPLGDVLTLAATGTEMNGNSVVTNWEANEKLAIGSPHVLPKFSILDPFYTTTVDVKNTAYGSVDIMAHVFEQYFHHTPQTPIQDRFAEGILHTVIENAPLAVQDPANYDVRANLMWAGTMALNGLIGQGVDQDWATHGIEHEVSAIYDIAHGAGLAILFPAWMTYVMPEGPGRFVQFAERIWNIQKNGRRDEEVALEAIARTRDFFKSLGAPVTLKEAGVDRSRFEEMARKAVKEGPLGAFKELAAEDVVEIFKLCAE